MEPLEVQIEALAAEVGNDTGSISQLIRHFASLPRRSAPESERLLMELKVLALLRENFLTHPDVPSVSLTCFPEVLGIRVSRGVFSPEFATDSYLWAKHLVERDAAAGKSVLEMGAGSGIISFMLHVLAPPKFLCAVDVSPRAVENLRANAAHFGSMRRDFSPFRAT